MTVFRTLTCSLGVAGALLVAGCSFQNFDYLKDEYRSAGGGASGSGGSLAGSGGSTVMTGGMGGTSGSSSGAPAGGTMGQAGEAGAPAEVPGVLLNGNFELGSGTDVTDWLSVGDVAAATVVFGESPRRGSGRLGHWLQAGAYQVSTSQVIKPLPDGSYTFTIWIKHSQLLNSEYIFAKGFSRAEPAKQLKVDTMVEPNKASDTSYTQIVLANIPVTSGKCEVGIYTDGGTDQSNNWSDIDDAEFTLDPPSGG